LLSSCQNQLQTEIDEAKKIVLRAMSESEPSIHLNGDKNQQNITVNIDTRLSHIYLTANKKKLLKIYYNLMHLSGQKDHLHQHDALVVAVFLNKVSFYCGGFHLAEDTCNTDSISELGSDLKLTEWVLDNFFGPILYESNITLWKKMNYAQKKDVVISIVSSFCETNSFSLPGT
jgi:hypothetical protein